MTTEQEAPRTLDDLIKECREYIVLKNRFKMERNP